MTCEDLHQLQESWQKLSSQEQGSLLQHFLADGVVNQAIVFELPGESVGRGLFNSCTSQMHLVLRDDVKICNDDVISGSLLWLRFLPLCLERAKNNAFVTIPSLLQASATNHKLFLRQ